MSGGHVADKQADERPLTVATNVCAVYISTKERKLAGHSLDFRFPCRVNVHFSRLSLSLGFSRSEPRVTHKHTDNTCDKTVVKLVGSFTVNNWNQLNLIHNFDG